MFYSEDINCRHSATFKKIPRSRPFYSASDPQDILFWILGIVIEEDVLGLRADYGLTPARIFAILTLALIDQKQSFNLNSCVPRPIRDLTDLKLPT